MTEAPPNDREARIRRHTENAIQKLSPDNQRIVGRLVRRRTNAGIRANSNQNFVFALRHVDRALNGKAIDQLTVDDVEDAIHCIKSSLGETTAFIAVRQFQRARTLLSETGKLGERERDAFKQKRPKEDDGEGRIIENHEFHAMLEAGRNHRAGRTTFAPDLSVAIQWVLWDAGPRANEALACKVKSVKLHDDGTADLVLPHDAQLLKTDDRTIPIAEGVAALKAWLAMHPAGNDPEAPLFPGFYDRTGKRPMNYDSLLDHIKLLARKCGFPFVVTPHDYRHTCATRKARSGWVEDQLRLFFGWSRDSKMPSRYVKRGLDELRARVRADLGMTPTGFASTQPVSDTELLAQLLKRIAQGQPSRTPAPMADSAPPR